MTFMQEEQKKNCDETQTNTNWNVYNYTVSYINQFFK